MNLRRCPGTLAAMAALFALSVAAATPPAARTHAHGQLRLEITIEGPTVVVEMASPLDNFVGFEHAPKTDAEQKAVDDALAQLRAADRMFVIDPAANCKLGPVKLRSAALGLGSNAEPTAPEGHADLDGTFAFNCTNTLAAKFIDVALLTAFKNVRQVDAQIAAPQGPFKRTLRKPNTRLTWNP